MAIKLGILTNMPTPYRNEMWKLYNQVEDVDLDFYYCVEKEKDRYWNVDNSDELSEIYLPGISISTQIHINFSIINVFKKYDAWIIGGCGVPTCQLLIFLCKIFNIPYILMFDGANPQKLIKEESKIKSALKRFFIKDQFLSLANGKSGKRLVLKYGLSEDRVLNQYLTVDVDWFLEHRHKKDYYSLDIRRKYNIDTNDIIILYVGRVVKAKGIHDLISAAMILKERGFPIKIMVVGEGEYMSELKKLSKTIIGTNDIIFCGEVDYKELCRYYYSADIFALPTHNDVWGLVVNEAMACGLPIITTVAAGAYLDLIDNNGYAYVPGDINELVSALTNMMGEDVFSNETNSIQRIRGKLCKLGENSLKIIKDYRFINSKAEFSTLIKVLKDYLKVK